MNKLIYILLFIISLNSFGQWRNWPASFDQYFLTYDGAYNNDSVGKFYLSFVYDTIATPYLSISQNKNNIYGITTTGGMLYIANNTSLAAGEDTIIIKIVDDWNIGYFKAIIHVHPIADTRFIDADATENGNGKSRNTPWDGWDRPAAFHFGKDTAYLQKRSTTESAHHINPNGDTGDQYKSIWIGAYGTGTKPIFDGTSQSGYAAIRLRNASYWRIYDLQIQDFDYSGLCFESSDIDNGLADSCFISDIIINNCSGNNAQIHIKSAGSDWGYHILNNIYVTNSPAGYHGIKLASSGNKLTNAYIGNNGLEGLHLPLETIYDTCKFIFSYDNSSQGINIDGDNNLIQHFRSDENYVGLRISAVTQDAHNNLVEYGEISNSDNVGMIFSGTAGAINNRVHGVKIFNSAAEGIYAGASFDDDSLVYCEIYDNTDEGIEIIGADMVIYNCLFYNNGGTADIYNNGGGAVELKNSFYQTTSGSLTTLTNIDLDDITLADYFQDYSNRDFRLLYTAVNAINGGTDVGLTQDIEGNPIIGDPDIGTYEYQAIRKYNYLKGVKQDSKLNGVIQKFILRK